MKRRMQPPLPAASRPSKMMATRGLLLNTALWLDHLNLQLHELSLVVDESRETQHTLAFECFLL